MTSGGIWKAAMTAVTGLRWATRSFSSPKEEMANVADLSTTWSTAGSPGPPSRMSTFRPFAL